MFLLSPFVTKLRSGTTSAGPRNARGVEREVAVDLVGDDEQAVALGDAADVLDERRGGLRAGRVVGERGHEDARAGAGAAASASASSSAAGSGIPPASAPIGTLTTRLPASAAWAA